MSVSLIFNFELNDRQAMIEEGPNYRDFFRHVEKSVEENSQNESTMEKLRLVSEKVAEKTDLTPIEALRKMTGAVEEGDPKDVIREWMRRAGDVREERREEVEQVISRLKDEANAPDVGDRVQIDFNEISRGYLTPYQEQVDGKEGVVRVRDPFSYGSQRSRYTVELSDSVNTEHGNTQMVHNLLPGEVIRIEDE